MARLAIESDIHLAVFPTVASCLVDLQFIPNDVYNGLEAIAENIDAWRVNLVTRIKQYASTINDLQSSTNSAIYTGDLNPRSTSNISKTSVHLIIATIFHLFDHQLTNLVLCLKPNFYL